ncbi:MAG: isopentenyl-diphosphate Delta-isomerase [Pyrinomonadaceae bacterium]
MFTLRQASVLLGLAVLLATGAFFVTNVELPPWASWLSAASVLLFALPSFYALAMWLGWRRAAIAAGGLGLFALAVELSAIVTGFPYGHFGYSHLLGGRIFDLVPWTVAFAWTPLVLGSYAVAARLTAGRAGRITLGAALLVAVDLVLDPAAVRLGFWRYAEPGVYYGVPFSNFSGWLLSGLAGVALLDALVARFRPLMPAPAQLAGSLVLIVFYWTAVALFAGLAVPAAIGAILLAGLVTRYLRSYFAFEDMVVLADDEGREIGTANKYAIHDSQTPLHKAFSVFLLNSRGELLLQQRAYSKRTWPGVWSNSCCGHPMLYESAKRAARRRLRTELGIRSAELHLVLPDYRYRAEKDGIVENELCPVFVAFSDDVPSLNSSEVAAVRWIDWNEAYDLIRDPANGFSPWAVEEIALLLDSDECTRIIGDKLPSHDAGVRAAA